MSRLMIILRYIEKICFEKIEYEEEVGYKFNFNILIKRAISMFNKL